ncbi:MAG: hypothetical protein ACF8LK_03480 [Phycisphaerales bacterium JB041]
MPLDWFGREIDASGLGLSASERRAALRAAHERCPPGRLVRYTAAVVAPPIIVAIVLSVVLDDWVAAQAGISREWAHTLMVATIVGGSVPWFAWSFGRFHLRYYREVLRERGARVCSGCGYRLDGLPVRGVCPECGVGETREA